MMKDKKLRVGERNVVFNLKSEPYNTNLDKKTFFYGFPLYNDISEIDITNIISKQNLISGYFLFIGYSSNEFILCNDISAGYRVYYHIQNENIYICDDFQTLLQMINMDYPDLSFNKYAYRYFEKHGYTTGSDTFFHNIKKLPPSSYLKITSEKIILKSTFPNVDRQPNYKKHLTKLDDSLKDTFMQLNKIEGEKILYFSGGKDSTLLALTLKELSIPFTAVYMEIIPPYKENYKDKIRAENAAKQIGIKYETIKIDTDLIDKDFAIKIANTFPFDQHFYASHYLSVKQLIKKYGNNLILINGQSSDTIFSFGSSENSFGHMFACLTFKQKFKMKMILNVLLQFKHGKHYYLPKNEDDLYIGFLDHFKNMAILSKNEDADYYKYCHDIIVNFQKSNYRNETLLMLLKIYSHLQGPDNQSVIKSALDNGITKVVLPYSNPDIIYDTIRYKSGIKEFLCAKYPVNLLIRKKIKRKIDNISEFKYPENIQDDLSNIQNNPSELIKSKAEKIKEIYTYK